MLKLGSAVLGSTLALILAWFLWRRISRHRLISTRYAWSMLVGGAVAGVLVYYAQKGLLNWLQLSIEVSKSGMAGSLLALFLFYSPAREAAKVLIVWPLYTRRALLSPRLGLLFACLVGAGFAVGESVLLSFEREPSWLFLLRVLCAVPAQVFFAGLWGYALGDRSRGSRWFSAAWFLAVLLHAFYDHIVFGRGAALLTGVVPMVAFMAIFSWLVLRDVAPDAEASHTSSLLETPSLRAVRRAMARSRRQLMLHWIVLGALVTLGVMIVAVAGAVYLGHRAGVDFAVADESDVRAGTPLILLGSAVLAAFPVAGYLIARASAAHSVLEPALSAGAAIVFVVIMLGATQSLAVVFALALAPLAFGLACAGAWFGLR